MSDDSIDGGALSPDDVIDYANLVALDALDEVERARVLRIIARGDADQRALFDAELLAAREAMAQISEATAVAPPAGLRGSLLDAVDDEVAAVGRAAEPARAESGPSDRRRMRLGAIAAAAAIVLGIGGAAIGYTIGHRAETVPESKTEQIFAAPDVRTTSGALAGGRATITYSPSTGEGVLVMNDVPSPTPGTVYQMWLLGPGGARLAGTMSQSDVAPSTTAVLTGMTGATSVAFTVGDAATPDKMIADPVSELPLG